MCGRLDQTGWAASWMVLLCVVLGCDQQGPSAQKTPPPMTPGMGDGSAWKTLGESPQVAVPPDPELAEAIALARAAAEGARLRWRADTAGRDDWAVKWAAPTLDGGIEHVWVRPVSWTRFRIEGWLASPPTAELLCGKRSGELVSFPADELSDWVRCPAGTEGRREGGFTVEVLGRRYGPAPP